MRATIIDLLHTIAPYDALEQEHVESSLAWLRSGAPFCRIAKPATPPRHLVSYFVLFDPAARALLLVDHRSAGLWLPAGGHVELEEHPATTVARELREELRLSAEFLFPTPIFLTVTETVGTTAGHTDVSLWYVLRGDAQQPIEYDPEEFERLAWFSLDQLPLDRCDPHLHRFAAKLQLLLGARSSPSHQILV